MAAAVPTQAAGFISVPVSVFSSLLCSSPSLAVGLRSSPALLSLAPLEESPLQDVSVDAVVLLSPSTPSADYGD